MAKPPVSSVPSAAANDIFHEVEEDLRQQQLRAFWKENGPWIMGGVVAAVILTGVMSFWRDHQAEVNTKATAALLAAAESADPAQLESVAATADKNHAMLALFTEAGLHRARGELDKAAANYAQIATMSRIDGAWRDLAKLYGAETQLETGDPAKLHATLSDLEDKKGVWRWSALELDGLLLAREGKPDAATKVFADLSSDPQTPPDIRARAGTLRDLYAPGGKG